jgi:hypothetical protein
MLKLLRGVFALFLLTGMIVTGCPSPNNTEQENEVPDQNPALEREDDLFVLESDANGQEWTVFRTTSERFNSPEGATLWTVWGDENEIFTSRTVVMGKSSGFPWAGYGIVFCQSERYIDGRTQPVMLVVMINNEGQYIIGEAEGGVFTDFGWWKDTPRLNRGAGVVNEITVSYEEESREYRLEINGHFIEHFRQEGEMERRGRNGYITVITPFDVFPIPGINVYFM